MYTHQKPHNNQPRTLLYATIIQKRKIHKVKKKAHLVIVEKENP